MGRTSKDIDWAKIGAGKRTPYRVYLSTEHRKSQAARRKRANKKTPR